PVRQCAFEEGAARAAWLCRDERLAAVGADMHRAAARIRRPERTVALGQDAFRPRQVMADVADRARIDLPAFQRIGRPLLSDQDHVSLPGTRMTPEKRPRQYSFMCE